jgi:hypothetical protein
VAGGRPRHPRRELEDLLADAEEHGWRIERRRKYYRGFCPCGRHAKTIHVTPSNPRYALDLAKAFERLECWGSGSAGGGRA